MKLAGWSDIPPVVPSVTALAAFQSRTHFVYRTRASPTFNPPSAQTTALCLGGREEKISHPNQTGLQQIAHRHFFHIFRKERQIIHQIIPALDRLYPLGGDMDIPGLFSILANAVPIFERPRRWSEPKRIQDHVPLWVLARITRRRSPSGFWVLCFLAIHPASLTTAA